MRVAFSHSDSLTPYIKTFWFRTDQSYRHVAGQFSELIIPHAKPDKRGIRRWFTLSSSPSEELVSITTKLSRENGSSFKKALNELSPGTEVNLTEPMGDFTLPEQKNIPIIFIAGGIGVTPARSMVKYLLDINEKRDITLFYAVNAQEDLVFKDLFSRYKPLTFVPIVKEAQASWKGETGMLDIDVLQRHTTVLEQARIYISGPEPMVASIKQALKNHGIKRRHLVTDYFPGYK